MDERTDSDGVTPPQKPKSRRGFASMDPERQREIASLGGRTAHENGTAHAFTSEEGRRAGRVGGEVVSRNRDYMRAIGSRGGVARSVSLSLQRGERDV